MIRGETRELRIDCLRGLACLNLVLYHVVGGGVEAGLEIAPPHPLRLGVDFLNDFRMPAFAFIAGYVYALRPVEPGSLPTWLRGKVRRLVVPGVIAITLFWTATNFVETSFARPLGEVWTIYVFHYAHYWFLQAILVLLLCAALLDAARIPGAQAVAFAVAFAWGLGLLPPTPGVMSLPGAGYLAPYFAVGIALGRLGPRWVRVATPVIAGALVAMLAGLALAVAEIAENGAADPARRDFQSLMLGLGAVVLSAQYLPNWRPLLLLGQYSFTIFLYHVFATSFTRRALEAAGVQDLGVHVLLGVTAGILLPVALHHAALRVRLARTAMLGLRPA